MTYVYGVTRRGSAAVGETVAIEHGDLAAVAARKWAGPVRAKRRELLAHADVVQRVFDHGPVLPLRFGTVFDSDTDVVDSFLAPRHDELSRLLRELDGLAELSVRAHYVEDAVLRELVRDDPKIRRLRERRGAELALGEAVASALLARRAADADAIVHSLVPHARRVLVEEPRAEYEVLRAAFLVERKRLGAFDQAVEKTARARAGLLVFKYVGPLPPHSFVELGGA